MAGGIEHLKKIIGETPEVRSDKRKPRGIKERKRERKGRKREKMREEERKREKRKKMT